MIKVLIVEPFKTPRVAEIDASLESYQPVVGGYIECLYPWDGDEQYGAVALICDEEGKYDGSMPNRQLCDYDVIYGTFFIAGIDETDFCSLSDDLIEHYEKLFHCPEYFLPGDHGLIRVKMVG